MKLRQSRVVLEVLAKGRPKGGKLGKLFVSDNLAYVSMSVEVVFVSIDLGLGRTKERAIQQHVFAYIYIRVSLSPRLLRVHNLHGKLWLI